MNLQENIKRILREGLNSTELTEEEAIDIIKKNCKKFIELINLHSEENLIFRRDVDNTSDFVLVKPSESETSRTEPASTNNIHDILTSNLDSWKGWPKRTKSLICASYVRADQHSNSGELYLVIPFDYVQIATCSENDFWYSFKLPKSPIPAYTSGLFFDLGYLENVWDNTPYNLTVKSSHQGVPFTQELTIPGKWIQKYETNWSTLKSTLERVKVNEKIIKRYFSRGKTNYWDPNLSLLGNLNKILDPIRNNFKLGDIKTTAKLYSRGKQKESWFEGYALMIRIDKMDEIIDKLLNQEEEKDEPVKNDNLQESIRRILREDLNRREKLKLKIINVIKHIGLDYAISMMGGIEKLLDILDIKDVYQFLNLFKDMETEYDQDDDFLMFRFREGLNYFGLTEDILYVNENIFKVLSYIENNDLSHLELQIKKWFLTTYNISVKRIRNLNR